MAQHNVIVPVVDSDGVKHYATMVDSKDVSHPGVASLWTIGCSQVAGGWESAEKLEELRHMVESLIGLGSRLKVELVSPINRKIAEVVETFSTKMLTNLNYHRETCRMCMDALNEES